MTTKLGSLKNNQLNRLHVRPSPSLPAILTLPIFALPAFTRASTLSVSNTADDSRDGSLRYAVSLAGNIDGRINPTINFDPGLAGQTIVLTNGPITVTRVNIDASALPGGMRISGNNASRIFTVTGGSPVVLNSLILTEGSVVIPDGFTNTIGMGGAIYNAGYLTLSNCILTNNNCIGARNNVVGTGTGGDASGGGIYNAATGTLTLNNCTLVNNLATGGAGAVGWPIPPEGGNGGPGGAGAGGGIYNSGTTTANNCTFANNGGKGGQGHGLYNSGGGYGLGGALYNGAGATLAVNTCTLASNSGVSPSGRATSPGEGGDIYNLSSLTVNSSTIASNWCLGYGGFSTQTGQPNDYGGGIYNGSVLNLTNSVVCGNAATNSPNIYGPVSGANNLIDTNAQLSSLGIYGGPTQTMPPLNGSPAIDAGADSVTNKFATDQRGYPRPLGKHVDIGAVEGFYNTMPPGPLTNPKRVANGSFQFSFTNLTDASCSVLASTNPSLPLAQWTSLGGAVESPAGSGHFQFTDLQGTNYPQRFYRVMSP